MAGIPAGPITVGVDYNHFQNVTLDFEVYPREPQVLIRFRGGQNLRFILESGGPVEYNFNGQQIVHGNMTASTASEDLIFENRRNKQIWFRLASGGGTAVVRVEAYHTE